MKMSERLTYTNFANSSSVYIEEFKDTVPVSRRIDNIMTKRKRTKGKTLIYKTLHIKLIEHICKVYLFVIVLSVLRFTDTDYPFGIFKLFL
jgi:hypothetical protein